MRGGVWLKPRCLVGPWGLEPLPPRAASCGGSRAPPMPSQGGGAPTSAQAAILGAAVSGTVRGGGGASPISATHWTKKRGYKTAAGVNGPQGVTAEPWGRERGTGVGPIGPRGLQPDSPETVVLCCAGPALGPCGGTAQGRRRLVSVHLSLRIGGRRRKKNQTSQEMTESPGARNWRGAAHWRAPLEYP